MISQIYHFLDGKYESKIYIYYYRFFKLIINIFYPLYIRITKRKKLNSKSNLIVSLTSFPTRIKKIYLVIESLLRQNVMPKKIILYLSLKQFNGYEDLPKKLKKLCEKELLNIKFVDEDFKSHKKYFYTVKDMNCDFITVDDDMIYPEDLIEIFFNGQFKYKNTICCLWADKITVFNHKVDLYKNWKINTKKCEPRYDILPIGCAGIFYPKNCFQKDRLLNYKDFMNLCPSADDLWLKLNSVLSGIKSVQLDDYHHFVFIDLLIKNNKKLCNENVKNSKNDEQLEKMLIKYPNFVKEIETEVKNE